jgi:DHA2 family multidrug resistance protein-like MFS transporter
MSRQWLTLMAILLVYIPVAIDATVLHVAAPTLSVALGTSGNELLWIIDIYSLVMAGMVLPMGALGDKIGFKRLLLLGSGIFGTASLAAAFSPTAETLIASRALLAVGAAMIVPATLAGIRSTFSQAHQRNMALGLWGGRFRRRGVRSAGWRHAAGAFLLGIGFPDQRADRAAGDSD